MNPRSCRIAPGYTTKRPSESKLSSGRTKPSTILELLHSLIFPQASFSDRAGQCVGGEAPVNVGLAQALVLAIQLRMAAQRKPEGSNPVMEKSGRFQSELR